MRTLLLIVAVLMLCIATPAVQADELALKSDHPTVYIVKKGDTLWEISAMFLEKPWNWPDLWSYNPQVRNPHLIYPGDELHLVYIDGQPRLVFNPEAVGAGGGPVKLSPTTRIEMLEDAIPAIPMDKIRPFLRNHRVLEPEELETAPYVLSGADGHLLSGVGDDFYARGEFDLGERALGIYRGGSIYIDPETDEVLGLQAMDIGSARLESFEGELATLACTRVVEEVRFGDRLIRDEDRIVSPTFIPKPPKSQVEGFMIAVEGGVSQIGPLSVVAINKGRREGLAVGDVLATYRSGEVITDRIKGDTVQMPEVRSGLVMIFRTFEKMSYGIVLRSDRPLAIMDRVRNP